MSDVKYLCGSCGLRYDLDPTLWRCSCGGIFDLEGVSAFSGLSLDLQPWSLWRYRSAIPVSEGSKAWTKVTMGEGMTPLISDRVGALLKVDFLTPTQSFKDRGASVLVAKAIEMGVDRMVADSSGNAGTSIAAYAARAGVAVEVFVPESTSEKKVGQLLSYGAIVHQIAGPREASAEAAISRVENTSSFYASHVYNPFFHHGTKTFVYEVWEQLGGKLGEVFLVPAGNGTLLLGVALGIRELYEQGLVDSMPRLVAVQSERCAPLARLWRVRNSEPQTDEEVGPTVAEGIAIAKPPRAEQMLASVAQSNGTFVTVSDDEILAARIDLLSQGIDVEPTGAVAFAGAQKWERSEGSPASSVVIALTGAGLKSPLSR